MNTRLMGFAIAMFAVGVAGFLAGWVMQPVEPSAHDRDTGALTAVESKIDRLLDAMQALQPTPNLVRDIAGTKPPLDLARVEDKLAEISQQLADLANAAPLTSGAPRASGAGAAELAALRETLPDEAHPPIGMDPSPVFGRSLASLLAAFGPPQRVADSGGTQLVLEYDIDADRAVTLWCSQGVLISAQATRPFVKRERERLEQQIASIDRALRVLPEGEDRTRQANYRTMLQQELDQLKSGQK